MVESHVWKMDVNENKAAFRIGHQFCLSLINSEVETVERSKVSVKSNYRPLKCIFRNLD